ncbi:MAG: NnrS family protein, partial [Alphaproteobacteria bacterium]|nr:NnrS family protein [Alphaproteobacteria bacterium]
GGRITPSFTRNWLVKQEAGALPAQFGAMDKLALVLTLAALLVWVAVPGTAAGAGLLAAAAVAGMARLARWQGAATRSEPLLLVLHVGYLWIPIGLALLALSHWLSALSETGALHALTIGAIGTMTLAVMSRATLGHTGRALTAGPGLTAAFVLISVAAVSRVVAVLWLGAAQPLLMLTAASWVGAYVCFLAVCGPMVVGRK